MRALAFSLLLPCLSCHPSMHGGDELGTSYSFWDRMDPTESLGEHQHADGISGDDE